MVSLMQHDEIINRMLEETGGDLSKPNIVSRLGEELGAAIFHLSKGQYGYVPEAIRQATNDFKYVNPSKLPKDAPDNKLAAEPHSFGKIFLGTWYDIFTGIYKQEVQAGIPPVDAVKKARDIGHEYLIRATCAAIRVPNFHHMFALRLLVEDQKSGSPYQTTLMKALTGRNLIQPKVKMLSNKSWDDIRSQLKPEDNVVENDDGKSVYVRNNKFVKLSDFSTGEVSMLSASGVDLANVELEVAMDSYYEFDADGIMVDEIVSTEEDAIEAARDCVTFIQFTGNVGDDPELMWEVQDGKLVRTLVE